MDCRFRLVGSLFLTQKLMVVLSLMLCTSLCLARPDNKSRFDFPAEALDKALRDFAVQAKCNISYEPGLVAGLKAPAVKGEFTPSDVLAMILKGTRLRAVNLSEDTVQVLESPTPLSKDFGHAPFESESRDLPATRLAYATPDAPPPATDGTSDVAPPPTAARSNDQELSEIVVTGTNITGVDNKTVPLLIFDRDAIERSGYSTTQDFILSLPQNVKSGGNSADGVLTGGGLTNIENSTAANLRGLGASSTLTLLDGHRLASASYGTGVDLSMIPLSAVERIEVLTDGSSAVYGSDAVGGVVNIILRRDFNGEETSARLDALTQGGGEQKQIGQSVGRTWATGGVLAVFQFDDDNAIHADQRTFTANLPEPTDTYPTARRYSGIFSSHQSAGHSLDLFSDVLLEHDAGFRAFSSAGAYSEVQLISNTTNSTSANAGLRWQLFGDWHLEANALFSQVDTVASTDYYPATPGYTNGSPALRNLNTIKEGDLKLDGTVFAHAGTSIKAAVGASYRREDFSSLVVYDGDNREFDRRVSAVYCEAYAQLISSSNAVPFIQTLDLSAAVRKDSYSDFGAKANPRFGLHWSPVQEVGLRAAYSTSFRAPDPYEQLSGLDANNVFILTRPVPGNPAASVIYFGNQTLNPESSRNLTAGLDYLPLAIPGTRFSLNYYRIVYSDRLTTAPQDANVFLNPQVYGPLIKQFPSDAAVAAFIADLEPAQTLIDATDGGTGLAGVRYGFPYGYVNATQERTEGLDLGVHSLVTLSSVDKLVFDLNATYIRDLTTTFCANCNSTDLGNTYGEPLKFRARASAGWSDRAFSVNAAVNYSNAYTDTNVVPSGSISSFTTTDVNAAWRIAASGTTLSFAINNIFNVNPPLTSLAFTGVNYDPSNADPRGRVLSFQVRQKW
jgi:iron complex outermembrane recepter protein